ncbi:MAG: hypothetical protein WCL39_04665, partial [Armatimonadota bacterium]
DTLYLFNSYGVPTRSYGPDVFQLSNAAQTRYDNERMIAGGRWIECTSLAEDGTLYGWYHWEPHALVPGSSLTAPRIGAVRSTDNGETWVDLGVILDAPEGTMDLTAKNGYFTGGNGDFSGMLDAKGKYMYFFISTYAGDISEQGVSVARMDWSDRDNPVGKVHKYYKGRWTEPGLGGHVSPIFPAKKRWQDEKTDAFWGPSIHWNTHLKRYVILMNHVNGGPGWPQDGIYMSYCVTLDDPRAWSIPKKILEATGTVDPWYPQIIGLDAKAKETDKLSGKRARFFQHGVSKREIIFLREGEKGE